MDNYLARLSALDPKISIGIVGIGSIGRGMTLQAQITPGIDCVAIADIIVERAIEMADYLHRDYEVVGSLDAMHEAIRRGRLAVCEDGELISRYEGIDVFVEATNSVLAGGEYALTAIAHGQHVVMMNYEADLMFGPYLMEKAEEEGLVYTVCDGDQPTVLRHIIDELEFMGFQLVMAGNIKGYLDRYVDPTSIIPEADKRDLDYRMCTSYTDGTKLCVEMAVLANGLGLRAATPGMYGPRIDDIYQVFDAFDFDSLWNGGGAVVDYVLGARPKGGVFAIGYTDDAYQRHTLDWFPPEMGPGPFYLFYRPYHLGHFESMRSIAAAALDGRAVLKPDFGFRTNVYAYAKRDLQAGESLDGMGGYLCYGKIENLSDNEIHPGIPICMAEDVVLKVDVPKDERILLEQLDYDPDRREFELHRRAMAVGSHDEVPV